MKNEQALCTCRKVGLTPIVASIRNAALRHRSRVIITRRRGLSFRLATLALFLGMLANSCSAIETDDASSISGYLGIGSAEDTQAISLQQLTSVENAVAACMASEGFKYVPVLKEPVGNTVGRGIVVGDADAILGTSRELVDPNEEILQSLSAAGQQEYALALYGNSEDGSGGCRQIAEQETTLESEPYTVELTAASEEARARLLSDPRFIALNQQWSRCMAAAGFSFASPEDITEYLTRGLSAITSISDTEPDSAPEIDIDSEGLRRLQDEEIAISNADETCAALQANDRASLVAEYEQAFLNANKENLDQLREAISGKSP